MLAPRCSWILAFARTTAPPLLFKRERWRPDRSAGGWLDRRALRGRFAGLGARRFILPGEKPVGRIFPQILVVDRLAERVGGDDEGTDRPERQSRTDADHCVGS